MAKIPDKARNTDILKEDNVDSASLRAPEAKDRVDSKSKMARETKKETPIVKPSRQAVLGTQNYTKIKEECLKEGKLFEDPDFPVDDSSLFSHPKIKGEIKMKRPFEFCQDSQFIVSGATRFDINQGDLGNCWYLASVACLTLNKKIFSAVVPPDNTFDKGKYCGAFHFRFWTDREWLDVVIDDRLPTQNNKLVYSRSTDDKEFWGALLEKAYAKLHGSYENMEGGFANEAFIHFMGGVNEFYTAKQDVPPNMFEIMTKAGKRDSFLNCSTPSKGDKVVGGNKKEELRGLVPGHMYSVTKTCVLPKKGTRLLRLRNPLGKGEWKGPWSDESPEWKSIPKKQKNEMGLTIEEDGEFWMSFEDVLKHFKTFEICHWPEDFDLVDGGSRRWYHCMREAKWIKGATAGGYPKGYNAMYGKKCPLESVASNPQYTLTLVDPDEDDDIHKCTLFVALMQKTPRYKGSDDYLPIGFRVYSLPKPEAQEKRLPAPFFISNKPVAEEPHFRNILQVCKRFSLDPGTYVIVPCTLEPGKEGEFVLRVFTESKVEVKEAGFT